MKIETRNLAKFFSVLSFFILIVSVSVAQSSISYRRYTSDSFSIDIINTWQVIDKNSIDQTFPKDQLSVVSPEYLAKIGIGIEELKKMEMVAILSTTDPYLYRDNLNIRRVPTGGVKLEPELLLPSITQGLINVGAIVRDGRTILAVGGRKYLFVYADISTPLVDGTVIRTSQHQYAYFGRECIWILTFSTSSEKILRMSPYFEHMALSFKEFE